MNMSSPSDNNEAPIARLIRKRLEAAFSPETLVIEDDSNKHAGHAGHPHRSESHFTVTLVAQAFENESRISRERMVHKALGDLLPDRIHALRLKLSTPLRQE
ncbi:BolA family protein [Zymomonas sp.]|uniref:BolA family protein n=1 Tax=Zymomonas sp. TaxID=2068624 RepID=UPI0025F8ADB7|nr:BolA family protein [Zymomonas sp.]MCA1956015.1 BolA family transcriptional regulator [Zymomonas sp.]